jgi:phospholipid/cholesterol/gamma-HCH transport system substrate-binding protein
MQSSPARDLVVGLFVLAGFAAVGYLSLQLGGGGYSGPGGLELLAGFDEIGGLSARAPVRISGVKIGQVKRIALSEDLRAQVFLDVDADIELPVDTSAAIRTAGLLGDQFIALEPGAEDELLVSGDELSFTEGALNIEKLIGGLVHGADLGGEQ